MARLRISFTNGNVIGAVLDRNGLRPVAYYVTKDDLVIMASEVGVLPIEPERVARKWRLQPGKIFLVDMKQGRIIDDNEIKRELVDKRPWRRWLDENLIPLDDLPTPTNVHEPDHDTLLVRQHAFGYTNEDLKLHHHPDGDHRHGRARVDGDRHAAGVSERQAAAAVQLFQAAVCAGDQSAAGCEF